jgi:hypothetical protein
MNQNSESKSHISTPKTRSEMVMVPLYIEVQVALQIPSDAQKEKINDSSKVRNAEKADYTSASSHDSYCDSFSAVFSSG